MNAEFQTYKDTLPKEPSGNVKKRYVVSCYSADDWRYIHNVLLQDGTLEDNIPSESITCEDDKIHSKTRGSYLLTPDEHEALKNHEKVKYVHIDFTYYAGTNKPDPDDMKLSVVKTNRYTHPSKNYRNEVPPTSNPTSLELNRCGWQLIRTKEDDNCIFAPSGSVGIATTHITYYGDGTDVDIVIGDDPVWYGHIEFQNNTGNGPTKYVGGNVLPGNGTCDLLDIVLDAPYYIDPDWFDADPTNRLITRWDGTKVPVESVARTWWSINTTSYRSSKFVSSSNGGTATGNNDFGTVSISQTYTRAANCGTHLSNNASSPGNNHGTPCASLAYGRTLGWAFNANKWAVNILASGSIEVEQYFDVVKIFHQLKPNRQSDNTKNPTVCSNSWLRPYALPNAGFYYYRTGTDGTGGVSYSTKPKFMTNIGSAANFEQSRDRSDSESGDELIDSGVIFCVAQGNCNQKIVESDHSDFNNYCSTGGITTSLEYATIEVGGSTYGYRTINRRGFPSQVGAQSTISSSLPMSGLCTYRTITVGNLHDAYVTFGAESKEVRSSSSCFGNGIDVFAPGDDTLAASSYEYTEYPRYDSNYLVGVTSSIESKDREFGGTSGACPVAAGLIATKLQYNRSWGINDVKSWITNNVGIATSAVVCGTGFYHGQESTSATDDNWDDDYSLEDDSPKIIWDAATNNEPLPPSPWQGVTMKITIGTGIGLSSVTILNN